MLAGLLAGLLAVLLAHLAGFALPPAVALPAGLVAGLLGAAGAWLPGVDPAPTVPAVPREPSAATSFGDLGTLRFAVETDSRDPDRFETRLRPRLTALTVERLWQRRRIDWRTEEGQAAARQVLTPALLDLLTAPPHALRSTPQTLVRWTRDLEDL